jgi:hypothetical protein
MAGRRTKLVTAETVLKEIDKIFEQSQFYQSRQSGKRFFEPKQFPGVLRRYVAQSNRSIREHAIQFGMSVGTLESIISGGRLSDNMLSRIRSSISRDVSATLKKGIFPGDWRNATTDDVGKAIATVSEKLVFLKKVIERSNSLKADDSPIDKIQLAQLLALLSAAIEALKAPYVETKQAGGFFKWLGKTAKVSVEKGAEKVVTDAMVDAADSGKELIDKLSDALSIGDIGNIF